MKIIESNGKKTVKISKKEWLAIGEKSGWTKKAFQQPYGQTVLEGGKGVCSVCGEAFYLEMLPDGKTKVCAPHAGPDRKDCAGQGKPPKQMVQASK